MTKKDWFEQWLMLLIGASLTSMSYRGIGLSVLVSGLVLVAWMGIYRLRKGHWFLDSDYNRGIATSADFIRHAAIVWSEGNEGRPPEVQAECREKGKTLREMADRVERLRT